MARLAPPLQKRDWMFEESFPDFLRALHSGDLEKGRAGFLEFAYRYLTIRPLPIFTSVPRYSPEDFKMDTIVAFLKNDARSLLNYKDVGIPFVVWFRVVAKRKALDVLDHWLRGPGRETSLEREEDDNSDPLDPADPGHPEADSGLTKILEEALSRLKDPLCRVILILRFMEGYTNKELAPLLAVGNERIGNHVRNCRDSMRRILRNMGHTRDNLGYGRSESVS
jgi:RNA polymerase sigma factor (sigma-70 family)